MGAAVAIVLAGGAGRRLGGAHKPALLVGGEPIVARVLTAVAGAGLTALVVGRRQGVPEGVRVVREDPPGGGPVAAVAAGVRALAGFTPPPTVVLLLAGDLPFVTAASLARLVSALRPDPPAAGGGRDLAVFLDDEDQPQWLCSAWALGALQDRLADPGAARGIRGLADGLRRRELRDPGGGAWLDVDTPEDLAAARVRSAHGR